VPAVATFWQMPKDEEAFLRYLARGEKVMAIRHMEAVPDPNAIRAQPVASLIGRTDAHRLYLTLASAAREPLPLFRWEPEVPGEPVQFSLPVEFPAIVYDAGALRGGELSQSNAAAYPSRAPAEVAAWMRRVFAWLRRATPHWHEYEGYRVSERAAQAALAGLTLVPYHGWSGAVTGRSSFAPRPGGRKGPSPRRPSKGE
jgi:hypothetical protein